MKKVCFVNGSPRGKNSGSQYLIGEMCNLLDPKIAQTESITVVDVHKLNTYEEAFEKISTADDIIFVFPLYIDSIPSNLLDFLYKMDAYINSKTANAPCKGNQPRVYTIVNNGFVEGTQNKHAVQVMQHFTTAVGYTWRFGVGIGAGEFMKNSAGIPMQSKLKRDIYQAFVKLKNDIEHNETAYEKNLLVSPAMSKTLFMFMGNLHWVSEAKKNKLSKKNLYRKYFV